MRRPTSLFLLLVLFLFSGCGTVHQAQKFPAYFFSRPPAYLVEENLREQRQLETKSDLSYYQRKRLLELWTAEMARLDSQSPRYHELEERVEELKEQLDVSTEQLNQVQAYYWQSIPKERRERRDLASSPYHRARKLWNDDQNLKAIAVIDSALSNPRFVRSLPLRRRLTLHFLRFRISLDIDSVSRMLGSYEELKREARCGVLTERAAFLMAIRLFVDGSPKRAQKLLQDQCEVQDSPVDRARRFYWIARFRQAAGEGDHFDDMGTSYLPSYYHVLAAERLGGMVGPFAPSQRRFLASEWKVSQGQHKELLNAEAHLGANLRRVARKSLFTVSRELRKAKRFRSVPAMLYCAHLLHAAGEHLEAFRLYSVVTDLLRANEVSSQDWRSLDYTQDMFPRPFESRLEWLARLWQVDVDFVYAIIRQESAFNPAAVSPASAMGMMQLMPKLGKSLSKKLGYDNYYVKRQLFFSEENLKLAVFHIHQLERFSPHPALMAAAYNAGAHRMIRWWKRFGHLPLDVFVEFIPITETRNYVKLILRNQVMYRALRTESAISPAPIFAALPKAP